MPNIRTLSISTEANEPAIARIWITWMIGIAQKWVTIHMLSGDFRHPQRELDQLRRPQPFGEAIYKSPIRVLSSPVFRWLAAPVPVARSMDSTHAQRKAILPSKLR